MVNKTKILTSIALMLLISVPISVFRVNAAVPTPETYIMETIGEPMTQDPGTCYDTASIELLMNIYDSLIFWNGTSTGSFIPMIADNWTGTIVDVTDPITGQHYTQTWTFHIKSGVHFQRSDAVVVTGEYHEVNVTDVEYSFERNMVLDSSVGGEILVWDPLLGIGAADLADPLFGEKIKFAVQSNPVAKTVTFYLHAAFEPFLQIMAQTYGAIMCKEWMTDTTLFHDDPGTVEREDNWPGTWPDYSQPNTALNNYTAWQKWHDPSVSPIELKDPASGVAPRPHLDCALGTGPYMLDYWDKGAGGEFFLVKNPDYWRGWASPGHVDNYLCKNIVDWDLRKADFLSGSTDVCVVPRAYMDQVLGQPGIRCLAGLPDLGVTSEFFNQGIAATSTFIGNVPANGTFAADGFPRDGLSDLKLRKAFRALFPFDAFLTAAYQDEAIQPASCVANGLAYYDPSVTKPAYDRTLAIKLLKEAWGGSEAVPGPVWTNGFTMGFVYNSGNVARQIAAEMLRDEFASINAEFGTHFTGVASGQPWSGTAYRLQWQSRVLPFYSVGWGADFPDAHNYVVPFMDGENGAFAKFQGFSNATINQWIRNGIDTIVPSERQNWYTLLQQAYNDNAYSFMLSQATLRRFERDWVQGWFFHPVISTEEYIYIIRKEDPTTVIRNTTATVGLMQGSSGARMVNITNIGTDTELVEYNEVISSDDPPITSSIEVWLRPGQKYIHVKKIAAAGTLTITATVRISSKWNPAIGTVNPVTVKPWRIEDINYDYKVDGKDITAVAKAFGSYPGHTRWNSACDINFDFKVDGKDVTLIAKKFGWSPP
jgi:peptide/nickel transport system substrate-binding protein